MTTVFNAMQNLQKEQALLGQALKTTGGLAHVNQKHILGLASAVSGYSGQSKVAILQGSRLLLSFTSVRNEVGKNNDIYDRAIKMSANLAAATGRDMPQAAKMLGKALQDPVSSLGALRRAGVVFTAQQTAQIKAMAKNGNLMGAQKLILDQLAVRYGGAARAAGQTFGGQMNRLKNLLVGFGVVAMQIVLPFLTKIIGTFLRMPRFIQSVIVAVGALGIALKILSVSNPFTLIITAVVTLAMIIWKYRKQIMQAFLTAWAAIKTAADVTWQGIRNGIAWLVGKVLGFFGSIVHGAAVAFGWIPGLGGKLKQADKWFQQFRDNVNNSIRGINGKTVTVGVRMTAATNPYPGGISGRAASGLFVRTGTTPTADDVLIRASRGELVVPARLVRAGAVDHLRGMIPGFASGGLAVRASGPGPGAISRTLMAPIDQLAKAFAKGLLIAARSGGGGYGGYGVPPKGPLQAYAMALLKARGWGNQWGAFNSLVMGESGWNPYATNPSSGAYGIPQALPAGKMASAGADWRTSGYTQLRWMMGYIASVYGSPARAYALWSARSPHWYGRGGPIAEPILGVGARTGRAYGFHQGETVAPQGGVAGDLGPLLARLDRLIAAAERAPARTGGVLAEALNRTGRRAAYNGLYGG